MRKHFGLLGLLSVAGLLLAGAIPVRAVSPVSFEDPAGDQLDPRASMDILRVSWGLEQASTVGRPRIVVEMTLAGPPEARLVKYTATGDAGARCVVKASYRPGTVFTAAGIEPAADFFVGCADPYEPGELVEARTEIKRNVITMSAPLDSITKFLRQPGKLTELSATTEIAEPVTGIVGPAHIDVVAADEATTDRTFRYA